ncbi:MAG: DNA-binding protein [archaeon]|nr:DNA-binding protein [archaeon]
MVPKVMSSTIIGESFIYDQKSQKSKPGRILMDTAEEIKKRKMENYLAQSQGAQFQQQMAAEQQATELQAQIKQVISTILSKEAQERIANIRIVKPEFALQVEIYLLQLFQAGRLKPVITDEQLKAILDQLVKKRETKIIRK